MWPFRRKQTAIAPSPQTYNQPSNIEQLQSMEERLLNIQTLLNGLREKDEKKAEQGPFDAISEKLGGIEALMRSFTNTSPGSKLIEDAIHEAFMRLYRMLRENGELAPPQPLLQAATPEGNVLLPLDPTQQYELLLMNPLQPEIYGARIILHSSYTRAYLLPYLANSDTQRYSLHINTKKAPPGFAEMLQHIQSESRECMYLGRRRSLTSGTFEVTYWPCVETVHAEDLSGFPDDVCLYFDAIPGNQSIRYSVEQTPNTPPQQSNMTLGGHADDKQFIPSGPEGLRHSNTVEATTSNFDAVSLPATVESTQQSEI